MANRFSDVSTSTYQPLSLQEIMMVPMAKQEQHDKAQAAADEYAALTAKRLQQDASVVDTRLGELRGSADAISQSLLERGVSRDTMAKIHSLKREKEREFSQQGLIGSAQANYETATKFVNELAEKKERQAGWSPGQAKSWAMSQVSGFKGTLDESGGFRSFSGKELDEFVDSNKWINENMAQIAADTKVMGLGKAMSVNQFTDAWQHGTIETKTKEKIIAALQLRAQYDPKLQASLKQSSFWTGEKSPNTVGDWKIIDGKRQFIPTSSFGMELLGAASGAAYRKENMQYNFVDDKMGYKLWEAGLDKKNAEQLVTAANGNLSTIPPSDYKALQNNISLATNEVAHSKLKLDAMAASIKARKDGGTTDPMSDPGYVDALRQHNESKAKYSNAQFQLQNILQNANKNMIPQERRMLEAHGVARSQAERISSGMPSIIQGVRGVFTNSAPREDYARKKLNSIGITDAQLAKAGIKLNTNLAYQDIVGNPKLLKGLILQRNGALGKDLNQQQLMLKVNHIEQRDKLAAKNAENYIKNTPRARDYNIYDGSAEGAFKSTVGGYQRAATALFEKNDGGGWNVANGGPSLTNTIAQIKADSKGKGVSYQVMPTDGVDTMGFPIEQVVITNKDTGETTTIPATRGANGRSMQKEVGKALMNVPEFADKGSRMDKNSEFLPEIQSLGIHNDSYKGSVIPGQMIDGKYVYIEKDYLKDTKVPGAKGSVGNQAVFRVRLIDPKEWNNNHKPVGNQASNSLGGTDDIIDIINRMKYGR